MLINLALNIVTTIIANLIFWAGGGIFLGSLLGFKRRQLFDFFGISNQRPVTIYMTSLPVQRDSIVDFCGIPSRYQGFVPHGKEFQVIPEMTTLFSSNTFQRIPDVFSGLVDGLWLSKKPIVEFELSPEKEEDVKKTGCISIGGPKFNSATRYYLRTSSQFVKFIFDETEKKWHIEIARGRKAGEEIRAESDEHDLAVVLRLKDHENASTIFILGGTGSNGTRAAVKYLSTNWKELHRNYPKKEEFGIILTCVNRERDPFAYKSPDILRKLPRH